MAIALKEDRIVRGMEAAAERPTARACRSFPIRRRFMTTQADWSARSTCWWTSPTASAPKSSRLCWCANCITASRIRSPRPGDHGSTARSVDNIEDFKTAIFGRIQSLAKTHLLLADDVRAVDFADILRSELDAFDSGIGGRITLQGPAVALPSQIAVSLGMAIHELTTNAAKHGALSVYGGKVEVTWSVTIDATRRTLAFDWVESGGPPVKEPAREGFGSRLLDFVLPGQIQARTRIEYAPQGVRVHCSVPLPAETKTNTDFHGTRGLVIANRRLPAL